MDVSGFSSAAIPTPKDIVQTCAVILFSQFDFSYKYLQILNFILKLMNFCFLVVLTHRVTVTYFSSVSMPVDFCHHLVGKNSEKCLSLS